MMQENMLAHLTNMNSTSFIFQDKYGVLFFSPLQKYDMCNRSRTQNPNLTRKAIEK